MASPGPNARTGQSRDHGGQALLGSQASARQSLTARRSRAVDRSRERHGWSIGVRVRPHRAPCGASLPVGRSVFELGRPETGVYPLTIGMMDQARRRLLALDGHGQGRDSQFSSHVVTHRPSNNLPGEKIEHDSQIEPAFRGWQWSKKRICASPPRTVRAPFSAYGSPFNLGPWP